MKVYPWFLDSVGLPALQAQKLAKVCVQLNIEDTNELAVRKGDFSTAVLDVELDEWEAMSLVECIANLKESSAEGISSESAIQLHLEEEWTLINDAGIDRESFDKQAKKIENELVTFLEIGSAIATALPNLSSKRAFFDSFSSADLLICAQLVGILHRIQELSIAVTTAQLESFLHVQSIESAPCPQQQLPHVHFLVRCIELSLASKMEVLLTASVRALSAVCVRVPTNAVLLGEHQACAFLLCVLQRYHLQSLNLLEETLKAIETLSVSAVNRNWFRAASDGDSRGEGRLAAVLRALLQQLLSTAPISSSPSISQRTATSANDVLGFEEQKEHTMEALFAVVLQLLSDNNALALKAFCEHQWLQLLAQTMSQSVSVCLSASHSLFTDRVIELVLSLLRQLALSSADARVALHGLGFPLMIVSFAAQGRAREQQLEQTEEKGVLSESVVRAVLGAIAALCLVPISLLRASEFASPQGVLLVTKTLVDVNDLSSHAEHLLDDAEVILYALDALALMFDSEDDETDLLSGAANVDNSSLTSATTSNQALVVSSPQRQSPLPITVVGTVMQQRERRKEQRRERDRRAEWLVRTLVLHAENTDIALRVLSLLFLMFPADSAIRWQRSLAELRRGEGLLAFLRLGYHLTSARGISPKGEVDQRQQTLLCELWLHAMSLLCTLPTAEQIAMDRPLHGEKDSPQLFHDIIQQLLTANSVDMVVRMMATYGMCSLRVLIHSERCLGVLFSHRSASAMNRCEQLACETVSRLWSQAVDCLRLLASENRLVGEEVLSSLKRLNRVHRLAALVSTSPANHYLLYSLKLSVSVADSLQSVIELVAFRQAPSSDDADFSYNAWQWKPFSVSTREAKELHLQTLSESALTCASACEVLSAVVASVSNHNTGDDIGQQDGDPLSSQQLKSFVLCGGLPRLVECLALFAADSAELAGRCLHALVFVAIKHKASLGTLGLCPLIMEVCKQYAPETGPAAPTPDSFTANAIDMSNAITQQCAAVMYNLAISNAENKASLLSADALVHLSMLLKQSYLTAITKHEIKDALNAIKY